MLKTSWTVFLQPASGQKAPHPFHITPRNNQYRVVPCHWQGTSDPGFIVYGSHITAPKGRHTRKDIEMLARWAFCATSTNEGT